MNTLGNPEHSADKLQQARMRGLVDSRSKLSIVALVNKSLNFNLIPLDYGNTHILPSIEL